MQSHNLEFQDFDLGSPSERDVAVEIKTPTAPSFRRSTPELSDNDPPPTSSKSFWTFEYYQQFFDVNTDEVKARILWSMIPRPGRNFLETYIKPNPDLYGPIWICTTLVFTIAVSGNVANYLQYAPDGTYHWKYDFHLISNAATAIFCYAFLIPLALYSFMTWNNSIITISFMELLCAYGYSLSIYIPVSILWVIQVSWFQWSLVLIAATLSGYVLVTTVGPYIEGPKKIPVVLIVITIHFLLAIGFMEYIFHVPDHTLPAPATELIMKDLHPHLNATDTGSLPHGEVIKPVPKSS